MSTTELTIFEGAKASIEPKRMDYQVIVAGRPPITLKRGRDFDKIKGTKSVSLLKAGAEQIIAAYGLLQHYTLESKIEDISDNNPFFYYMFRCDLCKIGADGKEYVFTSGYGSANTKEKRNGFNSAYDAANSSAKMACKRAMVAAAINIAGLSGAFTQDIEDENFVNKGYDEIKLTADDNAPVTAKQIKRLYAIGNEAGKNVQDIKTLLAARGYTSTKDIKQSEYDELCKLVGGENVKGQEENADTKKDTGN